MVARITSVRRLGRILFDPLRSPSRLALKYQAQAPLLIWRQRSALNLSQEFFVDIYLVARLILKSTLMSSTIAILLLVGADMDMVWLPAAESKAPAASLKDICGDWSAD